MAFGDFDLWEIRYLDRTTTFTTAYTAANNAAWDAGTATKLRFHELDVSELMKNAIDDPTVQTRPGGRQPPIPTLCGGVDTMQFKFKMWLEGGSSSTSPGTVATLMGDVLGGIKSPTVITDLGEAGGDADTMKLDTHGQAVGQPCIVGVLGDGACEGKVGVAKTITNANEYDLMMDLPGVPQVNDAIKNGHTVYIDWETETYQDFLIIGGYAGSGVTDDSICMNILGCSGTLAFGGLVPNEKPWVEFTFNVGQWRPEPYATTATFSHTTAPSGGDPCGSKAIGSLTVGDLAASTRVTVQGDDLEVVLGYDLEAIRDPQGANGIGGWRKVRGETGPTMSMNAYWGDNPGRRTDFTSGTEKQVMYVCGHVAEATAVFEMQRAYYAKDPATVVEFNRLDGQNLSFLGNEGNATDRSTADYELQDAEIRISLL